MEVDVRNVPLRRASRSTSSATSGRWRSRRGWSSRVELGAGPARRAISTDPQRLQQVLRNLLSNAFKFTDAGSVAPAHRPRAAAAGTRRHAALNQAEAVIAFSVTDTGIGIPPDKHRVIFEAFQQADGTTSRKYGGTGLGLSISREIASLLHGEIVVDSEPGDGQHVHALPAARVSDVAPPRAARATAQNGGAATALRSGGRRRQLRRRRRRDSRPSRGDGERRCRHRSGRRTASRRAMTAAAIAVFESHGRRAAPRRRTTAAISSPATSCC